MKLLLKTMIIVVINNSIIWCKEIFRIGLMLDLLLCFVENRGNCCCK